METIGVAPRKKNVTRLGAHLIFIDEAGFLLIPSVRKTWGPVGQTSILRHRYAHDRISAISGIAVSPRRCGCTLYCQLYEDNIRGDEVLVDDFQVLGNRGPHALGFVQDAGPVAAHGALRHLERTAARERTSP